MKILGFDIGGTFIKYGILDENGNIISKDKLPTPKSNCKNTIPDLLSFKANELKQKYNIDAIGISTAGQVDSSKGEIIYCSGNIPDFTGCEIKKIVESNTKINTSVENDANSAALGEMWQGAGKGHKYIVCLTLGTGVGGAIIINGRIYKGFHGFAGEFSRMAVVGKMLEPNERGKFVLDKTASTNSLLVRYKKATGKEISGQELMKLVKQEDESAVLAYQDFLDSLQFGIDTIVNFVDPEMIIIGGGISAQGGYFFDKVNKIFREQAYPGYDDIIIRKAELENDAGLLGAAYICINKQYEI
ncbi:MAG TPA: ROK family protein [Victivallales bacterium]|nr:ROK family protein [Victivallales bacterium]